MASKKKKKLAGRKKKRKGTTSASKKLRVGKRKARKPKSLTKFQRWLVNNPEKAKATLKKKGWKV